MKTEGKKKNGNGNGSNGNGNGNGGSNGGLMAEEYQNRDHEVAMAQKVQKLRKSKVEKAH